MNKYRGKVIAGAIGVVIVLILLAITVQSVTVEANEVAIIEKRNVWGLGDATFSWKGPGKHILIPGWQYDFKTYLVGTQKLTFQTYIEGGERGEEGEKLRGDYASIDFKVGGEGGQEVQTALTLNYRIGWILDENGNPKFSPESVISLHRDLKDTYRDVVLKRRTRDIVINLGTAHESALDIYSGDGFAAFKKNVAEALKTDKPLQARGILIEDAIVYRNDLDPQYVEEIRQKVIAVQRTLRKKEETKAAEEEAKRVFAEAQAEVERRTQEAEAKKIETVKAAEAQAEKERLAGLGIRQRQEEEAKGVLAMGLAEARVDEAKRDAKYEGTAGYRRASVELETARAEKYRGMLDGISVINEHTILQVMKDANSSIKLTTPAGE